jgi:small-conductance mechanosensitive channel
MWKIAFSFLPFARVYFFAQNMESPSKKANKAKNFVELTEDNNEKKEKEIAAHSNSNSKDEPEVMNRDSIQWDQQKLTNRPPSPERSITVDFAGTRISKFSKMESVRPQRMHFKLHGRTTASSVEIKRPVKAIYAVFGFFKVLFREIKIFLKDSWLTCIGICVASLLALTMYILESGGIELSYKNYPVLNWSIVAIVAVLIFLGFKLIEAIAFWCLQLLSFTSLWPIWLFLSSLKGYLSVFITAVTVGILWEVLDLPYYDELTVIKDIWTGIVVLDLIFMIRQLLLTSIFWGAESKAFLERSQEAHFYHWCIKQLCTPNIEKGYHSTGVKHHTFEDETKKNPRDWKHISDLHMEEEWVLPTIAYSAALNGEKFAHYLFVHIDSMAKGHLEYRDFLRFFEEEDASKIFYEFASGEGTEKETALIEEEDITLIKITEEVFKKAFSRIREHRTSLSADIQSSNHASSIMRSAVNFASWILVPIVFSTVLGTSASTIIVTLTSLLVSFSFAFGSSISKVVESAYFLFVVKPYKVGDRIAFWDGSAYSSTYIVTEINLMTTQVRSLDMKLLILPNHNLTSNGILNMNRMKATANQVFQFIIDMHTSQDRIETLKTRISDYLHLHKSDWKPKTFGMFYDSIEDSRGIKMAIYIDTRFPWQDGRSNYCARSEFIKFLRIQLSELQITAHLAPQPVIISQQIPKFL